MAKLPIGIVDTNRITHNLINLSNQSVALRENRNLSNKLNYINERVYKHNQRIAGQASFVANYLGGCVKNVGRAIASANPVRPHLDEHTAILRIEPIYTKKYLDNTYNGTYLHSTQEMYSHHRFQNSFPNYTLEESIQSQRDCYINALSWSMLGHIKTNDIDYIDAAVDFALNELNRESQKEFSARLSRRAKLISEDTLKEGHEWIQEVFKYHAQYESATSVKPRIESIPDMSLIGYIARTFEYDLVNRKRVTKEESTAIADAHHPMLHNQFNMPKTVENLLQQSQNSNAKIPQP
ncbi:hypothetical protein [Shewanella aestuarii]|uniref:Uncharacterized protein n=1 Tax=Shewanella aestuarii TaxID=1028752 RepID=A0A6G9QPM8_9GAMM|nr:hypothetical protein [Shewanella aestuarii]QIR16516.1 hypothetical protein HBH39_18745 [Shewanella aestuarii]